MKIIFLYSNFILYEPFLTLFKAFTSGLATRDFKHSSTNYCISNNNYRTLVSLQSRQWLITDCIMYFNVKQYLVTIFMG